MAPETLAEAERLILRGADLDAVCETLGVIRRTFERVFRRTHGVSPERWRRLQRGEVATKVVPPVSFRLSPDDRASLLRVAERDDIAPSEWARNAVIASLQARRDAR